MGDYIAGEAGSRGRNVAIGKDIEQRETRATNYFDFGRVIRERFEESSEAGVEELSRLVYNLMARIAVLEEQNFWTRVLLALVLILTVAIAWRVFH